jgi:hypothetical protein
LHQRFVVYTVCKAPPYRYHWGQSRLQLQHIPSLTHWIQLMHQCEGIRIHCQRKQASNSQTKSVTPEKDPLSLQSFWTWVSEWKSWKSFNPGCNLLPLQEKFCTQHT